MTQSFCYWTLLLLEHNLYLSPVLYLSVCGREAEEVAKCHGMGSERGNYRKDGERNGSKAEGRVCEADRTCLPCSIGDTALAFLQFTCTGLPKATASQAIEPVQRSDWTGGGPLAQPAAQQHFIGSVWARRWISMCDWLKTCTCGNISLNNYHIYCNFRRSEMAVCVQSGSNNFIRVLNISPNALSTKHRATLSGKLGRAFKSVFHLRSPVFINYI